MKRLETLAHPSRCHHQTRLRDVATDFDGIPLIGWMARSAARSQHEIARPQANQEARGKVASKPDSVSMPKPTIGLKKWPTP